MAVKRLTERQRKYARARAEGLDYADAYEKAGYSMKCKKSNRRMDAYHLENSRPVSPLIRAEIKRLQDAADAKAILNRQQRQALLTEVALDREEKTDNRLRAADMLNRMSGDYTDVVRSTVTGDVSLTYEERKRLLEKELMEE